MQSLVGFTGWFPAPLLFSMWPLHMDEDHAQRRPCVILAADVVG
jgi:hypothetical protein